VDHENELGDAIAKSRREVEQFDTSEEEAYSVVDAIQVGGSSPLLRFSSDLLSLLPVRRFLPSTSERHSVRETGGDDVVPKRRAWGREGKRIGLRI